MNMFHWKWSFLHKFAYFSSDATNFRNIVAIESNHFTNQLEITSRDTVRKIIHQSENTALPIFGDWWTLNSHDRTSAPLGRPNCALNSCGYCATSGEQRHPRHKAQLHPAVSIRNGDSTYSHEWVHLVATPVKASENGAYWKFWKVINFNKKYLL